MLLILVLVLILLLLLSITYELGFDDVKKAENFIYKYHENRNKVGKCEISIVEKIDLAE